jgi:ATP-dependent Clp protease ATP-binding subunit ClpC
MFERYTEKARRVIFFARYEASTFGSPYIETEHLLLGMLREDKALVLRAQLNSEAVRKEVESRTAIREKIPTSVDLPLSSDCRRALEYGAEEATALDHRFIDTAHLLLGLLRPESSKAAIVLRQQGVTYETLREVIRTSAEPSPPSATRKISWVRSWPGCESMQSWSRAGRWRRGLHCVWRPPSASWPQARFSFCPRP